MTDQESLLGGRYRLVRLIGSGGMGQVFLAEDATLGRQVAIKKMRSAGPADEAGMAARRLLGEARAAARIHHPNVVAVHDLLVDGDDTYIVMEYVPAENLEQRLRRGALGPPDVARIGEQMARALEAAHRLGIVHRDVKPSNILLGEDGVAKLADFGVARGSEDARLTQTGWVIGSVAFMPPEVARGAEATAAADVYSLGATLFTALEGHSPFVEEGSASTPVALLARLITRAAPRPAKAGVLTDLISAMLASAPEGRPTAGAVADALRALLETPAAVGSAGIGVTTDPPRQTRIPQGPEAALVGLESTGGPALDETILRTKVRPPASHSAAVTDLETPAPEPEGEEEIAATVLRQATIVAAPQQVEGGESATAHELEESEAVERPVAPAPKRPLTPFQRRDRRRKRGALAGVLAAATVATGIGSYYLTHRPFDVTTYSAAGEMTCSSHAQGGPEVRRLSASVSDQELEAQVEYGGTLGAEDAFAVMIGKAEGESFDHAMILPGQGPATLLRLSDNGRASASEVAVVIAPFRQPQSVSAAVLLEKLTPTGPLVLGVYTLSSSGSWIPDCGDASLVLAPR